MAFSKIILNGVTQIDLTQDTTQADKTIQGYTGHQNDGTGFTGTYAPSTPTGTIEITENDTYDVSQYATADVWVSPTLQNKTVTPTKSTQTIQAGIGYDGLGTVTVNPYTAVLQSKTATPTSSQQVITADTNTTLIDSLTCSISATNTSQSFSYGWDNLTIGETYHVVGGGSVSGNGTSGTVTIDTDIVFGQGDNTISYSGATRVLGTITVKKTGIAPGVTITFDGTNNSGSIELAFYGTYDGLNQVTVSPIPSEYIIPTGTKSITTNGTGIDVAAYATVDVSVPSSGSGGMVIQDVVDTDGGIIRTITGVEISGTKTITENGTGIDVAQYANVDVNVSGGGGADMIVYTSYTGSGVDKTSLGFDATSHDVYYTIPFDSSSTYIVEGATASTQGLKIYDTRLYSDAACTNLVGYYQIDNGVISQTSRTMTNCPWFMLGTAYKVCPYGYYGKIMVGRSGSELFSTNANVMSYINSYGNKLTLKYVGSELESALDNVINGNITSYINDSITFLPDSMFRPNIYNNITTFQAHNVTYTGNFALVGIGAEAIAFPKFTGNSNNAQAFNGNNYTKIVDFGPTLTQIRPSQLQNAYKLDTLILRCSTLVTLGNINNVAGTKFKSGGTGGTIYIPKVLYDHLGDGSSSDYQSATNWVTVYEYGTITWAQIEGSQYENYYADGTRVV